MSFPWAMLANRVVASREAASTGPASPSRRCERSTCLRSVMSLPISAMAWGAPRSCCHTAQRLVTTRGAPSRRVWTSSPSQWPAHRSSASIVSQGCGNWACDSFRHGPGQQKSADQNEHGPRCKKALQGYAQLSMVGLDPVRFAVVLHRRCHLQGRRLLSPDQTRHQCQQNERPQSPDPPLAGSSRGSVLGNVGRRSGVSDHLVVLLRIRLRPQAPARNPLDRKPFADAATASTKYTLPQSARPPKRTWPTTPNQELSATAVRGGRAHVPATGCLLTLLIGKAEGNQHFEP